MERVEEGLERQRVSGPFWRWIPALHRRLAETRHDASVAPKSIRAKGKSKAKAGQRQGKGRPLPPRLDRKKGSRSVDNNIRRTHLDQFSGMWFHHECVSVCYYHFWHVEQVEDLSPSSFLTKSPRRRSKIAEGG